jgi:hypothetical protein
MSLERNDGLALVSWSEGSLALWQAGMQVMNAWQRAWLDNISRTQGLFNVWPASSQQTLAPWVAPWADLAGRWGQNAQALASLATNLPGATTAAPSKPSGAAVAAKATTEQTVAELKSLEAAIAAKQGRASPNPGCLTGVKGGPVAEAALQAPIPTAEAGVPPTGGSVTSMLAMQAKSLARAVRSPRQAVAATPADKVAAKVVAKSVGKTAKAPSAKTSRAR